MVSKAATDYVKTQTAAGFKPDAIKKAMKKAGWKPEDIEAAMDAASPDYQKPARETREEEAETPKGKGENRQPVELPGFEIEADVYSAAMGIGRILPVLDENDMIKTLNGLHKIADKRGFNKFAGLIETLELTVEGKDKDTMLIEIARVGPRIREIFEEELKRAKQQAKK